MLNAACYILIGDNPLARQGLNAKDGELRTKD